MRSKADETFVIVKFKGFSMMVLRLVSGPMLEKSNKTGPLADR